MFEVICTGPGEERSNCATVRGRVVSTGPGQTQENQQNPPAAHLCWGGGGGGLPDFAVSIQGFVIQIFTL
jgi:hypothetical protein